MLNQIKLLQVLAYSVDSDQTAPGLGLQCCPRSSCSRSWLTVLTQIKLLQEQGLHCLPFPSGQTGLGLQCRPSNCSRSWPTVLTQIKLLQVLAYSVDSDLIAPGLGLQCRPWSNCSRSWPTMLTQIKLLQVLAYSVDPDQTAPGLGL